MKNKAVSMAIVTIIYIIAAAAGVGVILLLKPHIESAVLCMLIADTAATVTVYLTSLLFKNSSVYDPYWSVVPVLVVIGYYAFFGINFLPAHLFVLVPFLLWAVRLTANWAIGFEDLKWQDWRYKDIKEKSGKAFQIANFFGIMYMPTLLVFAGTIPLYYFISASEPVTFWTFFGGLTILSATALQFVADKQMKGFLRDCASKNIKGACIDTGVWRYSRHPNYLAEIMIWWGAFFAGLTNFNTLNLIGAPLITALFVFISIPLMENHILKSRPAYNEYRKTVISPLIPFLRREELVKDETAFSEDEFSLADEEEREENKQGV